MDLVLINPGGRKRMYQGLSDVGLTAVAPPVWAGLIAAFVRNRGYEVAIIDANAENLGPRPVAERIVEMRPALVAVVVYGHNPSASTMVMPEAGLICKSIKLHNSRQPILLIGGHVAALPAQTLLEEDADYVCDGEGTWTTLQLLEWLKHGGDISKVQGLWRKNGSYSVVGNVPAPNVGMECLGRDMPGVAWDLLPMDKYRAHNWHCFGGIPRQPYAALYSTLGCPYSCSYCCIQAPFRRGGTQRYRLWSPSVVVRQIDTLVLEYGVSNIYFADEMFVLNRKHILGIADLLAKRNYNLNMFCNTRVDTVDQETLEKLRAVGFRWMCLGIEAASERVRDDVKKPLRQEDIHRAVEMMHSLDIHICANYIFGLPEDDHESMQATLDLALELNCEMANFYCAMAYPGSALRNVAIREGWPLPKTWAGYSQHAVDTLPLPTRYLAGTEVLEFRDWAWHHYFTHPDYLSMIGDKFGEETVREIEAMTAITLERGQP